MKRVFLIHGWGGNPSEAWFPWIKAGLEKRGFSVVIPAMPEAQAPKMELWLPYIAQQVGKVDEQTYFIGHSIGCQAIIRYLATLPAETKIGGAVFVAGWYDVRNLEIAEEKQIAGPWVETPRDDAKIKKILNGQAVALFSDDDKWVDPKNIDHWKEKAGVQNTILLSGKGHFNDESNTKELPEALNALLELAKPKLISIDEFAKSDIRIGKIVNVERIAGADKLLKLTIDLGEGAPRTICSGVAQYYQPEELVGKKVPVITNLPPRKMKGTESQGMVLFGINEANGGHIPVLLSPTGDIPPGSPVQ